MWKEKPRRSASQSSLQGPNQDSGALGKKISGSATKSVKPHGGWKFCGYNYPSESDAGEERKSDLVVILDATLALGQKAEKGILDNAQSSADLISDVPAYDYYSASFSEGGKPKESEVGMQECSSNSERKKVRNDGFLSIGGLRLYTEDTSSPDEDDENGEEDSSDDSASNNDDEEDSSNEESSSDDYDDESDVDEELMEDYLAGIGGTDELLKAEWLTENLDSRKLGPVSLWKASEEYGMQKHVQKTKKDSKNNGRWNSSNYNSSPMDELMFAKDRRAVSRKQKGDFSLVSRSWPSNGGKSKLDKKIRGEKKKHRKELMARKRRERMLNRGVDLQQIDHVSRFFRASLVYCH